MASYLLEMYFRYLILKEGKQVLKEYYLPKAMGEALQLLEEHNQLACIIAGGTDLMVYKAENKLMWEKLVDISRIEELKGIKEEGDYIILGALTTHNEAAKSALINEKAAVLAQACREVGSLQIRNIATIGGNIVSAQPAADSAVALVALGATAEIVSFNGKREELIENLYEGVGKSRVNCTKEMITHIKFPTLNKNQGSSFVRLAKRNSLALPMLSVGVAVSIKDNCFDWVRIVMAPVSVRPVRALEAENKLKGSPISSTIIQEAASLAVKEANPRDSALRGSAEYRKEVLSILVRRALEKAVKNVENII